MASEVDEEVAGGEGPTSWTTASLRRTNEEMREHIKRLKTEVETEKNNVKRLERERVTAVKRARDEETARSRQNAEELKQKTARDHKEQLQTLQEACAREYETEARRVVRECEDKVRSLRVQWDNEKCEELDALRKSSTRKARDEAQLQFDMEKKKAQHELFEMADAKNRAEQRMKELQAADRAKAEDIRRMHDDHQAEMAKMKRTFQQDSRKLLDELQEKRDALSRKEKQLIEAKRKKSQIEMEKESLEDSLSRVREADSWQRMSPRAPIAGIGDISYDTATSPLQKKQYGEREKQLIQRNSELSILARRLEESLSAMTTEKESLSKQLLEAKLSNEPLEEKAKDLMKKYNALIAKHRRLEDHSKQTSDNFKTLKSKHDTLLQDFDTLTKKARRNTGQSRLSEQQREELESLRQQNRDYYRTVTDLKQKIADKDRQLKQALSSKRSLLKKQEQLKAEAAAALSRSTSGISGSQSFSGVPSPTQESSPIPASKSFATLSRTSSMESFASALQDEADQAVFDRDELETDYHQLEREDLHLRRVFALHFQHSLSDNEREEYEELAAECQQQQEAISKLQQELQIADDRVLELKQETSDAQEQLQQASDNLQMGSEEVNVLTATCKDLTEAKAALSEGLETAWQAVEEADSKSNQLEDDLAATREESVSLQGALREKENISTQQAAAKDDALQTALEDLQRSEEASLQLREAVTKLEDILDAKQQQLEDLKLNITELKKQKRAAESQVERLQSQLHGAQLAGNEESKAILEQLQSHFEEKEKSLIQAMEATQLEVEQLQVQLSSSEAETRSQQADMESYRAETEAHVLATEDEQVAQQRVIDTYRSEIQNLQAATDDQEQVAEKFHDLNAMIARELSPQLGSLLTERCAVLDAVSKLCQASTENDVAEVSRQIAALQQLLSEGVELHEMSALVGRVEQLTATPLTALKQNVAAAAARQATAVSVPPLPLTSPPSSKKGNEVDGGGMALAIVQDMLKAKNDEVEDLQLQLRSRNEEHMAAVQELEEHQQDGAVLKAQCQRLSARLDIAQGEVAQQQGTAMKLESLECIHEALKEEYAVVRRKVEAASNAMSSPQQARLAAELETCHTEIEDLNRQKDSLSETNEALNSELLLLWRLVSLELKLAERSDANGERSVQSRLRELETALQNHKGVETTVARIMEERGRNAVTSSPGHASSDGSGAEPAKRSDSTSSSNATVTSLQDKVGYLSDECKEKEDMIEQLEAEIAQLTTKLSCNVLTNLSESQSSFVPSDSSPYASPRAGQMQRAVKKPMVQTPLAQGQSQYSAMMTPAPADRKRARSDLASSSELPSLLSPAAQQNGPPVPSHYYSVPVKRSGSPGAAHPRLASLQRHTPESPVTSSATSISSREEMATASLPLSPGNRARAQGARQRAHSSPTPPPRQQQKRNFSYTDGARPSMTLPQLAATGGGGQQQLYLALDDFNPTDQLPDGVPILAGSVVDVIAVDGRTSTYIVEYQGIRGRLPMTLLEKLSPSAQHSSEQTSHYAVPFDQQQRQEQHRASARSSRSSNALPPRSHLPVEQERSYSRGSRSASPQPSLSSLNRANGSEGIRSPPVYLPGQSGASPVPCPPTGLHVERKLEDNLLLAWTCPQLDDGIFSNGAEVIGYRVSVDDEVTEDISGAERRKVLLEQVDITRSHVISVATISGTGSFSAFARIQVTTRSSQSDGLTYSTSLMPSPPVHTAPHPLSLQAAKMIGSRHGAAASPDRHGQQHHHHQQQQPCSPVGSAMSLRDLQPGLVRKLRHETATDGPYLAIALKTFSPSPQSASTMLQLHEGDIVEVLSNDPAQPWVIGRRNNQQGAINRELVERLPNIVASHQEFDSLVGELQDIDTVRTLPANTSASVRAAVALYAYEPRAMSPRHGTHSEELAFKKDDLMWIMGDEDENGFYQAEVNGRHGFVPASFVEFSDVSPGAEGEVDMGDLTNVTRMTELQNGTLDGGMSEGSIGSVSSYASSEFYAMANEDRLKAGMTTVDDSAQPLVQSKPVVKRAPSFVTKPMHLLDDGKPDENESCSTSSQLGDHDTPGEDDDASQSSATKGKATKKKRGRSIFSRGRSFGKLRKSSEAAGSGSEKREKK